MTQPLRWGIMATGLIAETFVKDLHVAGLPVVAAGSRDLSRAQAFADRLGLARAHGSYEALVSDPEIDVIYVATPHPFHLDGARLALEAGKHVLVEKPFAMNAAEARQIAALAEARQLFVMEAMWTRFLPHMRRLREILASGRLGRLLSLRADHGQALPSDPGHRLNDLSLGGGALLDLGIYPVSFACEVLGLPEALHAVARFKETGADAAVEVVMRHAGDALSQLSCASDIRGPNTASVVGESGSVEIDATWYAPARLRLRAPDGAVLEEFEAPMQGRGMQYQALALQEAVQAGQRSHPLMSMDETIRILEVMDEIRAQIGLTYPERATG